MKPVAEKSIAEKSVAKKAVPEKPITEKPLVKKAVLDEEVVDTMMDEADDEYFFPPGFFGKNEWLASINTLYYQLKHNYYIDQSWITTSP